MWELINENNSLTSVTTRTYRMAAPKGWIIKEEMLGNAQGRPVSVALVFIKDPEHQWIKPAIGKPGK